MPPPPHHWGIPPPPPHPGDGKRKAPISAGAFAFDLSKIGTPQKKPRTVISAPNELQTPSRQSVTPSPRPPKTSNTPQRKLSVAPVAEHATSAVTPLKQAKPLGALPSPFITPARARTTPDLKHRPLQSIMDDASPFVSRPRTSALKEGEKLVKLGELSAGKVDASPRERLKREDEGVGVSPRKPKAIKWNGKGSAGVCASNAGADAQRHADQYPPRSSLAHCKLLPRTLLQLATTHLAPSCSPTKTGIWREDDYA